MPARHIIGILIALTLGITCPEGRCAGPARPRAAGAQKGKGREDRGARQARELAQKAEEALQGGDLARALQLFQQAHDARPLPVYQLRMGDCHRGMGNAARAAFSYRQYLRSAGEIDNRQEIEELARRMEALAEAVRQTPGPGEGKSQGTE